MGHREREAVLACGVVLAGLFCSTGARAQDDDDNEPGRGVARISLIDGDVSVRRGDSGEWVAAAVNAPLVVEDRISTGSNSRAEVQFDYANMIRLGSGAEVRITQLENRRYLMQVAQGTVIFRVLRNSEADVEVSTPSVSVRPRERGSYRITVNPESTEITVRSGEVEIFTPRGVERLNSGGTMLVRGSASQPEFQTVRAIERDDFDRWNEDRDRYLERSRSYQYVHRDIYGADDLDDHGSWVWVAPYGHVWRPRVAVGWAPYRYGRWTWADWYGWTWHSYDPWGWAPFHYGRWFWAASRGWCWYPGGLYSRHYWRPALVGFFGVGGFGVGVGFGRVGWVPLAPYERYHPWYGHRYYGGYRSPGYIDRSVNITQNVNITNIYRNSRVTNGVTAVDAGDFGRGRLGNIARVDEAQMRQANLIRGQLPVAPGRESLRWGDREVSRIPRTTEDGRFFSRRQPAPVDRVPFSEQRNRLEQISRHTSGDVAQAIPRSESVRAQAVQRHENGAEGARGWRSVDNAPSPDAPLRRSEGSAESSRGWRRFGEPPAPTLRSGGSEGAAVVRRSEDSRQGGGGWRRFGEPAQTLSATDSTPIRRNTGDAIQRGAGDRDRGSWRRFGDSSLSGRDPVTIRRDQERTAERGWLNFGEPRETGRSIDRGDAGRRMERQAERPSLERSRPESLQIAPPVIRERSIPRVDGGGSFGGRTQRGEVRSEGRDFSRSDAGSVYRGGGERMSRGGGGWSGGSERMSRGGGGTSRSGGGGRRRWHVPQRRGWHVSRRRPHPIELL